MPRECTGRKQAGVKFVENRLKQTVPRAIESGDSIMKSVIEVTRGILPVMLKGVAEVTVKLRVLLGRMITDAVQSVLMTALKGKGT